MRGKEKGKTGRDKSRDKMQNKRQGRMTKVKQKMSPMGRPDAR